MISRKGVPGFDVLVKRPVVRGRLLKVICVKAVDDLKGFISKRRFRKAGT